MFTSKQIGIQNCIDPFYIEDGGKKYLFFGSFHGIYGVELTADGLHVKQGAKPREVAGTVYGGNLHQAAWGDIITSLDRQEHVAKGLAAHIG